MANQALQVATPTVKLINGTPKTTSLDIADHFKKRHDNVLRSIQTLEVPKDFALLNFEGGSYLDENKQERPMYNITRDGFTILVMGFTGKQAMEWKIKYLQAFNLMEARLKEQESRALTPVPSPVPPSLPQNSPARPTLTWNHKYSLEREMEHRFTRENSASFPLPPIYKFAERVTAFLLNHFQVERIDQIPDDCFDEAMRLVWGYSDAIHQKKYNYPLTALYPGGEKNRAYQKSKLRIPFPEVLGRHSKASQVVKLLDELTADGNDVSGARREVDEVYSALRWFYEQAMTLKRKLEQVEGFGNKAFG